MDHYNTRPESRRSLYVHVPARNNQPWSARVKNCSVAIVYVIIMVSIRSIEVTSVDPTEYLFAALANNRLITLTASCVTNGETNRQADRQV